MAMYRGNPKHKRGARSGGPARWFPDPDALCPDDVTTQLAQALLDESVDGIDEAHPSARARYAVDGRGRFFKAYSEDHGETRHGYPVREELVGDQVPARVLREFRSRGLITAAQYKRLIGRAR
jgi:hypothetical protein